MADRYDEMAGNWLADHQAERPIINYLERPLELRDSLAALLRKVAEEAREYGRRLGHADCEPDGEPTDE